MAPVTDCSSSSENEKFILSFSNRCSVADDSKEKESQNDEQKMNVKPFLSIENTSNTCMAKTLVEEQKKLSKSRRQKCEDYDSDCTSSYSADDYRNTRRTARTRTESWAPSRSDSSEQTCRFCNRGPPPASAPIVEMTTCDDWQKDLVSPMQRLAQLLSLGHLADVTLSFDTSTEVFKVHRLILATASPVFERMFYGNSKEALTGQAKLHCPAAAMKWVLENLYLGKTDFPTVYVAIMVFDTAQLYQLSGITALTKDFLKYEVSLTNVSQIFEIAKLHSEKELLGACVKKLCSSWPATLQERLSDLTEDIWLQLVNSDALPISEVQLFLGLYQWIKMRQEEYLESVSSESIRKEMDKFLPKLRLLSIPSDKFIDHVMPTNIFSPEECSSILLKLRGFGTALVRSVQCSSVLHGRVNISQDTMRFVVLNRNTDSRKHPCSGLTDMALIREFTVSSPVLLHQIQTHDSATLKYAQMTITDSDGRHEGVAKPYGSHWKFVTPTLMQANKTYTVSIDKVMVSRPYTKKDFNITASDVKFRGSTGDNYIKITFWPALIKN